MFAAAVATIAAAVRLIGQAPAPQTAVYDVVSIKPASPNATGMSEQLGFKLVPEQTTVQIVVIDRIEKPTEN